MRLLQRTLSKNKREIGFYQNYDFWCHHENLDPVRKVLKQILWDLSVWKNLPQISNYGTIIAQGKVVGRNLEQIQVEGCKLAAGGEPSTKFPPGGLVETVGNQDHSELPRLI